jgi:putative SOS response-associated peptidase YedK
VRRSDRGPQADQRKGRDSRDASDLSGRLRCVVPVDGFFEWHATSEGKGPYAVAMRDGSPFALGGLWENWKSPVTGQWVRTFCIITTPANVIVSRIHRRMPLILARSDLDRWLGAEENPADLLRSYPSADMQMWPSSMRVNSPDNNDPSILEPATAHTAPPRRRRA